MLANFDLNHLLSFPLKEAEDRKHFLIGLLVYLAAFIIPVIPVVFITGYAVRIMRQVLSGEKPHMVPWDDWGGMFTDGARLFGVRLVIFLPFFLLLCPLMMMNFALPFLAENAGSDLDWLIIMVPLLMSGVLLILMPVMLVLSVILPAAEVHVAEKNEFGAAFRVREWWPVFRASLGDFLLALVITYAISFVLGIIVQIAMVTIVLICLLPVLVPGISLYTMLILYTVFAQAYKTGRDRLETKAITVSE